MSEKVIIIDNDEVSRTIIKNYLQTTENTEYFAEFDNYEAGKDLVASQGSCIVLIDISDEEAKKLEILTQIHKNNPRTQIVALSNNTSTNTIIKAMRAGASEFITKPLTETAFINLINELANTQKTEEDSCKIVSIFSNKGGLGKTSIAVNLAVEIAEMTKEKVALIDLNLQLGDVSTFLDLTPTFDVAQIIKNIDSMDDNTLLQSLCRYQSSSLYVAADPVNIENSRDITEEQIKKLLNRLKKIFSYVIIDLSTSIETKTITAMDMSDLIILVAIVNIPAIRNMQRCMNLFEQLNYPTDKIKLVLNRYMENEEIKTTDIEDVVKQKVYWKIPNNYLTMMSAVNKGVPVNSINPDSNISINYKDFASKLCDYLITRKLKNK